MGYWMRFFDTHKKPLTIKSLKSLAARLRRIDRKFDIGLGQLMYEGSAFAQVEISVPGDGVFDNEIAEFRALVEAKRGTKAAAAKAAVLATLDSTRRTIVLRVGDHEKGALELLDIVWDCLFEHRSGLLQADSEGFYEGETLILALK